MGNFPTQSPTVIANLAISHVSGGQEIANIDTENSENAKACRRFYDTALNQILRDFDWPFATKIAELSLISTAPNDDWDNSYRYPPDCLKIRRILSGTRNDTMNTKVPYKVAKDTTALVIYTDTDEAEVEYTERVTSTELYPPDFVMALSFLLAFYIAPRLTGGDPFKLRPQMQDAYLFLKGEAAKNAENEESKDKLPESEFITGRE